MSGVVRQACQLVPPYPPIPPHTPPIQACQLVLLAASGDEEMQREIASSPGMSKAYPPLP